MTPRLPETPPGGPGPTGHDKAVEWLGGVVRDDLKRRTIPADPITGLGGMGLSEFDIATTVLTSLRDALAAGDPDVAEALGGSIEERFSPRWVDDGPCNGRCQMVACDDEHRAHRMEWRNVRRFATDWTEA